ncbi:fibronectin type III-like domain-contianing protein [Streptosporangium sp. DT93]|uniref:fibronectin type III-like domain-contianing protein n=1 Tax=Streptosporangium sp. DT93 TaxID=3393428 RepID=UPI003CF0663B
MRRPLEVMVKPRQPRAARSSTAQAGEPPKRLVGWARVTLAPNASRMVEITVDPAAVNRPLSYWDAAADRWTMPSGQYTVQVGGSSRNISLNGTFRVS